MRPEFCIIDGMFCVGVVGGMVWLARLARDDERGWLCEAACWALALIFGLFAYVHFKNGGLL